MNPREPRPLLWPAARVSLNLLIIAGAAVVVVLALVRLRLLVIPLLLSLLVATLLVPPADLLRRYRVPSALATLLTMIAFTAVVAGAFALVAPQVADQVDDLGTQIQEGLDEAIGWLAEGPLGITRAEVEEAVSNAIDRVRENAGPLAQGALSGAVIVGEAIAGLLLMVVLVFFFVHDGRRIWGFLARQAPPRHREFVHDTGVKVWGALGAYVRGVVVIALVDALLIGLALWIIGVPLVVPLMLLTFFGAFIPLIGAVVAGAVAALVALVSGGVVDAVLVIAAITAVQQIEGDVLYPLIVGRAIELHPVAILAALTAGTILAGIIGALLAVPIAAAGWVMVGEVRARRVSSAP